MAKQQSKPHITRTLGPVHFEDLDPHRFEDLVRQLVYDFRQWQSLESTGRGGADDGFDIRAYEVLPSLDVPDDDATEDAIPHPMEGNVWMVQCKREKEIGPKKIAAIISKAVSTTNAPYGYILAAPAHFSKAAHDRFREELRSRGVMEFYLWGAGELEDLLYQPKNDRVLFAFFGISLTSRRRSRATEIRASVSVKNRLKRILGDNPSHSNVLIRDLNDVKYPFDKEYIDFAVRPRWKEYSVEQFHPLGLIVSFARHYAFLDKPKGEWDFAGTFNILAPFQGRHRSTPTRDIAREELGDAVKGYWEQLPRTRRAILVICKVVRFDAIVFVDDKGDTEYECPHLFVDFDRGRGPFAGSVQHLEINAFHSELVEDLKRVNVFPPTYSKPEFGTIHKDCAVTLDDENRSTLSRNKDGVTFYDTGERYKYLKPADVIAVDKTEDKDGKKILLKITNVALVKGKELLDACENNPNLKKRIENQISKALQSADDIFVVEALVLYDWQVEQNRPVI